MRLPIFALAALMLPQIAATQVYVWNDPMSGTRYMSSTPPGWYRSGGGPRVVLLVNGSVVDDTWRRERQIIEFAAPQPPDPRDRMRLEVEAPPMSNREQMLAKADELMNREGGHMGDAIIAAELRAAALGQKSYLRAESERQLQRTMDRWQTQTDMRDAVRDCLRSGGNC